MAKVIWDVNNWYRVGRGRGFCFRATGEEVVRLLQQGLPQQWAPYVLVNVNFIKRGKIYEPQVSYHPIEQLPAVASKENWVFFIMSKAISGDIDVAKASRPSAFCSLNGMLALQFDAWPAAHLGIVDRVENFTTGEIVEHTEYLRIYTRLARVFRPYKVKE